MPDASVLRIEKLLAAAHMALWRAAAESEHMRDQGLTDDLYQLAAEVGRVNVSLLENRRYKRSS